MTPAEAVTEAAEVNMTFEEYADMVYDQLFEVWEGQMETKDLWVRGVVRAMENAMTHAGRHC